VGVFGAEAGAMHHFNVSAAKLAPMQAARMAAMLPRPRYYDKNRSSNALNRKANMIVRGMGSVEAP
jgi:monofunctional glycosyltransferase